MSSFCKITIGKTPGATRANAMYITRPGACEVWETHNVPDDEHLGITREDQRGSIADYLCEYAEQGRGERRDYRAVLSFDREVEPDRAMEMAQEWIEATRFRDNPALYACHTNTDNLHIHVLVTARDTEGRKLDLSDRQYKSFDKAWAKIYDREIERGLDDDHSRKCEETQSWKQDYAAHREDGREREEILAELGNIPRDRPTIAEYYQEKRTHDEQSLADSLGHEHGLLRGVQEDHRGAGPEDCEPGGADPGNGESGRGAEWPADQVAEAYKTLKTGLQFYEAQAKGAAEQHYQLKKQYEMGLDEHRKKLSATFKELSARYEANAKREIAKAVESVKSNERSAEEICKNFARNLLKDFGSALPAESKNSGMPSTPSAKR